MEGVRLDPRATPFLPGRRYVPRRKDSDYAPSAPKVNITEELLNNLHRMEPGMGGEPAEVLGVTAELIAEQERDDLRRLNPLESSGCPPEPLEGRPECSETRHGDCSLSPMRQPDLSSTPLPTRERGRPVVRESPVRRRGPRLTARDWSFLPGRRNRRRRRNLNKKINYTDEGELTVCQEVNKKKTGLRWKSKKPRNLKFVDDGMILAKINMDSADVVDPIARRPTKSKHDLQSQNVFRRITCRAEARGMVVNKGKTKILCISDAQTYTAACRLQDADGDFIRSGGAMKVLGFHLDGRPSVHAHVAALQRRMRETAWVLRHLKLAGFTEAELATVYRTVVRPILDYCAVVYHPMPVSYTHLTLPTTPYV